MSATVPWSNLLAQSSRSLIQMRRNRSEITNERPSRSITSRLRSVLLMRWTADGLVIPYFCKNAEPVYRHVSRQSGLSRARQRRYKTQTASFAASLTKEEMTRDALVAVTDARYSNPGLRVPLCGTRRFIEGEARLRGYNALSDSSIRLCDGIASICSRMPFRYEWLPGLMLPDAGLPGVEPWSIETIIVIARRRTE